MSNPNQQELKEFCSYNPITGVFKRIKRRSWKGNIINCNFISKAVTTYGYLQLNIFGRPYLIHRLIFLYMKGELPKHDVDHINGDRLDNRWCNLRLVERCENLKNMGVRNDNTTGCVGVSFKKDAGKYEAYINENGKKYRLGLFADINDAIRRRNQATLDFNFHPNHGGRPAWRK